MEKTTAYFFRKNYNYLICLLISLVTSPGVMAEIELLQTYQAGKININEIAALKFSDSGDLLAVDRRLGVLTVIKSGGSSKQHNLAAGGIFKSPELSGVSIVGKDYLVSNAGDDKVAIINDKGSAVSVFGEKGSKAGMLSEPMSGQYSLNDRIYIANRSNSNISIFNRTGVFLSAIGNGTANPLNDLKKPSHVSVDGMEKVYVLEEGSAAIVSVYSHAGELLKRVPPEKLKLLLGGKLDVTGLTADLSGRLFLADSASGKIIHYDWKNNKVLMSFGSKGKGPGQYLDISALTISQDNRVAVADRKNKKIDVYKISAESPKDFKRVYLPNIGRSDFIAMSCTSAFRLNDHKILCLDSKTDQIRLLSEDGKAIKNFTGGIKDPIQASYTDNEIAVLNKDKIIVFDSSGKVLSTFGSSGSKDGQLKGEQDIYLRNNKIYIAEEGNKRIQIFSMKGVYLNKFPKNNSLLFEEPTSVAVDSNENVFVADNKKKKILVFSKSHKLLYQLGGTPGTPSGYINIADLALDTDNNLYVLGSTGLNPQTIQVYSGKKLLFEFGSSSKQGGAAITKGNSISISPTSKTLVSIFDIGGKKSSGLLTYNYLQVPAKIGGVVVSGGVDSTYLKWQRPPGSYISGFRIYGSVVEDGGYKFIRQESLTKSTIEHKDKTGYRYYKVGAISGFGTEGPLSSPRRNWFPDAYDEYQKGNFEKSAKILAKDLEENPDQASALKYLGLSYLKQGKFDLAQQQFIVLGKLPGFEIEGLNLQVEALFEKGEYADAMALVQDVIKASDNNVESYINCGKLSIKIGDPIGAVDCLEGAKKIDAQNPFIYLLLGEAYVKVGATDNGLAELEKASTIDPENIDVLIQSALIYQELGKQAISKQKYQKALQLDKDNTKAQLGLAQTYLKLKELPAAKNIAISLAGKQETEATGHYLLGLIALSANKYGEAAISLGRATRSDPQQIDAWLSLADAYQGLKQPLKVKDALKKATEADQSSFLAYKRLGLLLNKEKDYEQAGEILRQAVELQPNDYEVRYGAAYAYYQSNRYGNAAEHCMQAIKIKQDEAEPLMLSGQIAHKRGKTGAAIEDIKKAIALKSDSAELHEFLGKLYFENNIYDDAKAALEKAAVIDKTADEPHVILGKLYSNRRLFDKAIKSFEHAVKLNGSSENRVLLDTAFADKKKSLDFSQNAPQLVLEDLNLDTIFSAAYKQYTDKAVGSIKVKNVSGSDYGNLKVSFEIKGYMDFPTNYNIEKLSGNSTQEVPLKAAFNNKVLEIDEDTGVQVEVKLSFVREGRNDSINVTRPMTIYGKNAIVWKNANMIGSFVTPKDDTLRDFVRQLVNEYKPNRGPLSENLVTAMSVFDAYTSYGIKYSIDPNNPFTDLKEGQIDYVQFARETLKIKSGDCDDLSVLISASLENLGIETALIDVPGHLFMMFNTTIAAQDRNLISGQDKLLVIRDGQTWIPVETTMIATNFTEAWAEGARKFYENKDNGTLKVIPLKSAWKEYQPVTLSKTNLTLAIPGKERVLPLIEREMNLLLEKGLARLVMPYEALIQSNPKDIVSRMQVAIIYARYGLYNKAIDELDNILEIDTNNSAIYNNRGNIYFAKGDYQRAYEAYSHAERLDVNDGGIKLNMALTLYKDGNVVEAKDKFNEAVALNQEIAKDYTAFANLLSN